MRLVQFVSGNDDTIKLGILQNDEVVDAFALSLVEYFNKYNSLEELQRIASTREKVHQLKDVKLVAPITNPNKVISIGMNHSKLCDDLKIPYPPTPVCSAKITSNMIGPFDNIVKPPKTNALNWELELVIVIGKIAKDVEASKAFDYVFGYTAIQDLTAFDFCRPSFNGGQFLLAKSFDSFCPIGPCVATKDEIDDVQNLQMRTWVNGVLKQDGNSGDLIHTIDKIVEYLSSFMTLFPGDIILTGSPSGIGYFQDPPECLKVGDVLESEIQTIGKMRNKII